MNVPEHEQLRGQIAAHVPSLGRPSKLDNRYFRFQKALGPEKKLRTTVAVYFRDVGPNLLELAFEPGAVAECIGLPRSQVVEWLAKTRESTGIEVHPNPQFNYPRIGIKSRKQLEDVLAEWKAFAEKAPAKQSNVSGKEGFVHVPFYLEADGSKTLFLPHLTRRDGFQIGEKGNERYIRDYWDALAALQDMSVPRFRRPNRNNIPGIIACKPGDYDEVKREYIEEQLKNTTA